MKQKMVFLADLIRKDPAVVSLLLNRRENVVCRNQKSGKLKQLQFRALYENNRKFWARADSSWQYYIEQTVAEEILEHIREQRAQNTQRPKPADKSADAGEQVTVAETTASQPEPQTGETQEASQAKPVSSGTSRLPSPNFGAEYARVEKLETAERASLLQKASSRLQDLAKQEHPDEQEVADVLVESTQDAALANRATVFEAVRMGNEQAKAYTDQLVQETHQMVKSTIQLIDNQLFNDELLNSVIQKSNGTVVQHMTRVFLTGLDFLLYYNKEVITRGIGNRIRVFFNKKYKKYYQKLLPHLHEDHLTLERVFMGGMKSLEEVQINRFATGFLIHDVGKAEDIEYHEGEAEYDRSTVEKHVKIGYRAVMEKTNYPREAALITGYHHEYYGDPAGYGYFRDFLRAYKESNPAATIDWVMSYKMEPLIDYQVLAYFPAKMLEVVDVFDSLTDKNRKYREPLSPEGALNLMKEQFVEARLKLDPILFDLFIRYLVEREKIEKSPF